MQLDKMPRHYAAEICGMPTRDERKEALAKVPEHLRELVKLHVTTAFNLKMKSSRMPR